MNTEEELKVPVGKTLLGVGSVVDKNLLMFFFHGCSMAVRCEGGALIWEVYEETEH